MKSKYVGCIATLLIWNSLFLSTFSYAEQGDFIVRLRGIGLVPDDSSGLISSNGIDIANSGVGIDSAFVPELDLTYMITKHIGVEAIAGMANHTVELEGTGIATATGVAALGDGFEIFDTWVLPPTITLQYHFIPDANIRPYVGIGVNYTNTFGDNATDELEALLGPVSVNTTNSWGLAAQGGVDIDINETFFFNIDVKYIDVDTEASLETKTAFGTLRVDLDVDPWVVGAGVGMRF